jgi:hypothetical protein
MADIDETAHVCSCGGNCGCHDAESDFEQVTLTREAYITRLENYLARLKEEIELVEGELVELRQEA